MAYGEALPVAKAKQRSKDLEELFKLRGYTVKSDSPFLTRVVKTVFGNVVRRRISTYSLVLRTAQKEGITADKLAGWIEERGGVQEVKLSRCATYVSPKAKAAKAKSTLSAFPNLAIANGSMREVMSRVKRLPAASRVAALTERCWCFERHHRKSPPVGGLFYRTLP